MYTRDLTVDWGVPGQTGTLAFRVVDVNDLVLVARTTVGVVEYPAGSGLYTASVANWQESWSGRIIWDDGVDFAYEGFTSNDPPVSLPPTRALTFEYRTGTPPALTDVVSVVFSDPTGTFGARRSDTGEVLTAPVLNQVYTRDGTGLYSYTIPEPGFPIEYWAKYTLAGAIVRYQWFISAAPAIGYTTYGLIRLKLGTTNANVWADLENNASATDIDAMLADAIRQSTNRVNLKLIGAGVTLPFVSPSAYVTAQVQDAATDYAAGYLLKKREDQSSSDSKPNTNTPGDALIAEGDAILDVLIDVGALTVTTSDDTYVISAPAAAGPTVDANGCPVPATCCGYDRLYTRCY